MAYGYVTADNGFTVETWFKRTANPTTWSPIFHQATQSAGQIKSGGLGVEGRHIWFGFGTSPFTADGAFYLDVYKETGTNIIQYADPSPSGYANDNQWHHVALRLAADKVTWTIFLDGESYLTGTASSAWDVTSGVITIGGDIVLHRGFYGYLYDSSLAYFAIRNEALTDNRIMEHYTAGKGGTVYYGDTETERIDRILDWADVPIQSRALDSSMTTLQGIEVANANALEKLNETVGGAFGMLFADGQTRIVYHNRRHRYNRFNTLTVGESRKSAPEVEFEFVTDHFWVYNDVRGNRPYGATIRLQDAYSRAKYGRKVYSFTIPVTSADELRNAVTWFLGRYGSARPRVSAVKFNSVGSDLIETMGTGGIQVGDVMTMVDLDAGNSPDDTMQFFVEGMQLDANFKDQSWTITLTLSPYELNRVFQIGVSRLGDGSYVAF